MYKTFKDFHSFRIKVIQVSNKIPSSFLDSPSLKVLRNKTKTWKNDMILITQKTLWKGQIYLYLQKLLQKWVFWSLIL